MTKTFRGTLHRTIVTIETLITFQNINLNIQCDPSIGTAFAIPVVLLNVIFVFSVVEKFYSIFACIIISLEASEKVVCGNQQSSPISCFGNVQLFKVKHFCLFKVRNEFAKSLQPRGELVYHSVSCTLLNLYRCLYLSDETMTWHDHLLRADLNWAFCLYGMLRLLCIFMQNP